MTLMRRLYRPIAVTACRYCSAAASAVPQPSVASEIPTDSPVHLEQVGVPDPSLQGSVLDTPPSDNETSKQYSSKIVSLVDQISSLTLLEVADLNQLLKSTLKLPDVAMAAPVAAAAGPAGDAAEDGEGDDKETKAEKLVFNVKLVKFDPDNKVKLIKEIKSLIEGMNLVQAKKFVEGAPQMIMSDIPKEEAEKIKEKVEAAGGTVEVE